ncbi:hypothetical protein [Vibrio sp. SS-MA-C1-2]|nr:hypothetical protein [Vibrio sp. SS-MA-C1-2]
MMNKQMTLEEALLALKQKRQHVDSDEIKVSNIVRYIERNLKKRS